MGQAKRTKGARRILGQVLKAATRKFMDANTNPRVEKILYYKKVLRYPCCPPNKGENTKRRCKHKLLYWKKRVNWKLKSKNRKQYAKKENSAREARDRSNKGLGQAAKGA